MRDIKFRALCDHKNEFAYGSLLRFDWADFIVEFNTFEKRQRIRTDTIGQLTGFIDRGGVEIYEGDIVRFADKYNYDVRFEEGRFVCYHTVKRYGDKWGDLHQAYSHDLLQYDFRVIGNIYNNLKLIDETP